MRPRALAGVALAQFLSAFAAHAAAQPKAVIPNQQKAKQKSSQTGHAHHLLKAEEQLVEAESALVAQNAGKAQRHVTAALKQVQEAIAHHHKHHLSNAPRPSGFGGAFQAGRHHHHHATLKQAEAELIAAEKALLAGNTARGSKDITRAAKTIKNAVASHHLFGKA
jgi:hypothetical protein